MNPFLTINNNEEITYTPFNNFSTADLGEDRGNNAYSTTTKLTAPMSRQFFETFDSVGIIVKNLQCLQEILC